MINIIILFLRESIIVIQNSLQLPIKTGLSIALPIDERSIINPKNYVIYISSIPILINKTEKQIFAILVMMI